MTLYDEVCSNENLLQAFLKAKAGKSSKWYVKEFEKNLDRNLIRLESELRHQAYRPEHHKVFIIRDPKTRKISAPAFRDRVVHHAINNILETIFDKCFIHDSYASRKGKGTHAALKRFDAFKRKATNNGKYRVFVLKADIRRYYDNVDHGILLGILDKKLGDQKTTDLARSILYNGTGKGMPLGSLTSQLFANIYLNELDMFVKHKLRARFYIRYMDDFVILHRSEKILMKWMHEIDQFLNDELKIKLHTDKSSVRDMSRGIKFLGFRVFYYYKLPNKKNLRAIKSRVENGVDLCNRGIIPRARAIESLEGWNSYAIHGDTYKLRKHLSRKVLKSLK